MEFLRLENAQIPSVGWEEGMWDTGNGWERDLGQGLGKRRGKEELGFLGTGMSQGLEGGNWDDLGMKGIGEIPRKNIPWMHPHLDKCLGGIQKSFVWSRDSGGNRKHSGIRHHPIPRKFFGKHFQKIHRMLPNI